MSFSQDMPLHLYRNLLEKICPQSLDYPRMARVQYKPMSHLILPEKMGQTDPELAESALISRPLT